MMLASTNMQQLNPFQAAFSASTAPYISSARFFIPPPQDSRAAPAKTARGFIRRTLSLLKPLCKPSTYYDVSGVTARITFFQQTTRVDTLGAVSQGGGSRTAGLVDHAKYRGMPRDTCRVSPAYCSDWVLAPPSQGTKFIAPRWFVTSTLAPRLVSLISSRVGFLMPKQGRGATCQS